MIEQIIEARLKDRFESCHIQILNLASLVAELTKALFSGVNAPAALSALCHWGFDSCASFEIERWREFILKAK